jgi:hypothetical protein
MMKKKKKKKEDDRGMTIAKRLLFRVSSRSSDISLRSEGLLLLGVLERDGPPWYSSGIMIW